MRRGKSSEKLILLVPSLGAGGAESVCIQLANYFVESGFECEVWVLNNNDLKLKDRLLKNVVLVDLKVSRLRYCFLSIACNLFKKPRANFLVFNQYMSFSLLMARLLLFRSDRVVTRLISHMSSKEKTENWINRQIGYKLVKLILPLNDLVIAQSMSMKNDLVVRGILSSNKVINIPNPVFINNEVTSLSMRSKTVLFVGRLSAEKNVSFILDMFKIVENNCPDYKLKIVGDGPLRNHLENHAKKIRIESSVQFEGYQADLAKYYRDARLVVLASTYEGFPNVLLESISFGTPIVAYDCESGPGEIIKSGKNGFLIENLDQREFATKVIQALNTNTFDENDVKATSHIYSMDIVGQKYQQAILGDF